MNETLSNSSNVRTSPTPSQTSAVTGISIAARQVTYSIICTVAILGNTLVILVFVWDKKLLKKSYNLLILSLAIADVLTAITLITYPAFVLGDSFNVPTNPFLGEIFCRVIWSRVFIFQLVVFSVYLCLALTVERWFAVVKPHKYSTFFSKKRILIYVFSSWVWSLVVTCTGFIETVYSPSSEVCEFRFYQPGSFFRTFVSIFQINMKMILPCLLIIGFYIHMVVKTNKSPAASAESKTKLRGKMTRMIGAVSFILIICLVPNQIYLVLAQAGKAKLDTTTHHLLSLFVFINTCVNPIVYGLSNKNYRHYYRKILFAMCPRALRERASMVRVDAADRVGPSQQNTQEENRQ